MTETESNDAKTDDRIPCEVYSRIVGYIRPVRNWNKGKKQEFADRMEYNQPEKAAPCPGQ